MHCCSFTKHDDDIFTGTFMQLDLGKPVISAQKLKSILLVYIIAVYTCVLPYHADKELKMVRSEFTDHQVTPRPLEALGFMKMVAGINIYTV